MKIYYEEVGKYRLQVEHMRDMSAKLFEKQLIYVTAGTIAASVFIMDRFLNGVQRGIWLILISWGLLGATILINLLSHFFAGYLYNKIIGDLINRRFDSTKADNRVNKIMFFNIISLISYFIGIAFFAFYLTINIKGFNKPVNRDHTNENIYTLPYQNLTIGPCFDLRTSNSKI